MAKTKRDYEDDYTEPKLRERLKEEIKRSDKGGKPGQWSARKSQLLTRAYEREGGGYKGEQTEEQRNLERWTDEEWQTKEGRADAREGGETARYLPKKAWERMSPAERRQTDGKKREASRSGQQHVANTDRAKGARRQATGPDRLAELNVDEAAAYLPELSEAELREALDRERAGPDRKTLVEKMERELERR